MPFQLQHAESGAHFVHFPVDSWGHHCHFINKTEILQVIDMPLGLGVRRNDGAAFKGIEYLGSMKTEYGEIAMLKDAVVAVLDSKGVRSVIDDLQSIVAGDFFNFFYIAWPAIAVHGHDGAGVRRDRRLDPGRVHIEAARLDIDEDWLDVIPHQRVCRGDK